MAKKQKHTQNVVATTSKTTITQKQSQDMVQFLLYSGLSMLAWVRNFFSDKAFEEQVYNIVDRAPDYMRYVVGDVDDDSAIKPRTFLHNLRRHRSRRADAFIDWLECGAFSALRAGKLEALQVHVHTDPNSREKVVETYTFSIQYHNDSDQGVVVPAGIKLNSTGSNSISLEATNVSLMVLLQHIGKLASQLPDLPAERYVSMRLFLNEATESVPTPDGFEESGERTLLFASAEGWDKKVASLEELDSTYHSTVMKITHLAQASANNSAAVEQDVAIPADLTFKFSEIQGEDIESLQIPDKNNVEMRKALREMMQPEKLTQGDTQTQSLARLTQGSSSNYHNTKLMLQPDVLSRLTAMEPELRKAACKAIGVARSTPKAHTILCQCEYNQEEDDIVYCSFCNTWQHLHCYGYTGNDDPRLPETHACYQCLLSNSEGEYIDKLQTLAARRRGISFALCSGLKSKTEFHNMMGNDKATSDNVFQYLKDNRLVVQASGCHKPGFAKTGKPTLVPNMAMLDKIINDLFDPYREVARFYSNPTGVGSALSTKLREQLTALQTMKMPPPATPRSMIVGKLATPGATLDLRQSMTPFVTPAKMVMPTGQKRALDDNHDSIDGPVKRGRSLQTTSVINVDGMSSPITR